MRLERIQVNKLYYPIFFFAITFFAWGFSDFKMQNGSLPPPSPLLVKGPKLIIHNRPLAKINGRVVSLYDVVKKMDLFLFEYSQDRSISPVEKYQFYVSRWEKTLDEIIDDQLILLDAAQKEIKVSDAEVREELEARFGPQILSNLHQLNYGYEEAREMIRQELTTQQLLGMKVHVKAFQNATPKAIKQAYQTYLEQNPPEEEWIYQILSIRGEDQEKCRKIGEAAYDFLKEEKGSLEELPAFIGQEEGVALHLSDDCSGTAQKLSKMHLEVIKELTPHSYSPPISQTSRLDNKPVVRLFYLKEYTKKMPKSLDVMHDSLKNQILMQLFEKEKKRYICSLKKRFGYESHNPKFDLPADYQPFAIL